MPNKRTGRDYLDITGNIAEQRAKNQRAPLPKPPEPARLPKKKKKKKKK